MAPIRNDRFEMVLYRARDLHMTIAPDLWDLLADLPYNGEGIITLLPDHSKAFRTLERKVTKQDSETRLESHLLWVKDFREAWQLYVLDYRSTISQYQFAFIAREAARRPVLPRKTKRKNAAVTRDTTSSATQQKSKAAGSPKYHPLGFVNTGVTCYMNASLQFLWACRPLRDYLLAQQGLKSDAKAPQSLISWSFQQLDPLIDQLAETFSRMRSPPAAKLTNESFLDICYSVGAFRKGLEEDAAQCIMFLLDLIHTSSNVATPAVPSLNTAELQSQHGNAWSQQQALNGQSIVTDVTMGMTIKSAACPSCVNTTVKFDFFRLLVVRFPTESPTPSQSQTLDELLLNTFSDTAILQVCPQCMEPRPIQTKDRLARLPRYLIIQLSRFQSSDGASSKIMRPVQFPVTDISFRRYQHDGMQSDALYDCVAVVHHRGTTLTGGHYVTYIRETSEERWASTWTEYNDEVCTRTGNDTVQGQNAYILLYKMQGPLAPPNSSRAISSQLQKNTLDANHQALASLQTGYHCFFDRLVVERLIAILGDSSHTPHDRRFASSLQETYLDKTPATVETITVGTLDTKEIYQSLKRLKVDEGVDVRELVKRPAPGSDYRRWRFVKASKRVNTPPAVGYAEPDPPTAANANYQVFLEGPAGYPSVDFVDWCRIDGVYRRKASDSTELELELINENAEQNSQLLTPSSSAVRELEDVLANVDPAESVQEIQGAIITRGDLQFVKPNTSIPGSGRVPNQVIDASLSILVRDYNARRLDHDAGGLPTFAFPIGAVDPTGEPPGHTLQRLGLDGDGFFAFSIILIPVHLSDLHSALYVMRLQQHPPTLSVYNSLLVIGDDDPMGKTVLEWFSLGLGTQWPGDFVRRDGASPQQIDDDSCGVFIYANALSILDDREPFRSYNSTNVSQLRLCIGATLVRASTDFWDIDHSIT